jgi:hypothetical protein
MIYVFAWLILAILVGVAASARSRSGLGWAFLADADFTALCCADPDSDTRRNITMTAPHPTKPNIDHMAAITGETDLQELGWT